MRIGRIKAKAASTLIRMIRSKIWGLEIWMESKGLCLLWRKLLRVSQEGKKGPCTWSGIAS